MLSAEVGVEGLWRQTQEALGTRLHSCPSAPPAWPTEGPEFPQGTESTQGLDWPPSKQGHVTMTMGWSLNFPYDTMTAPHVMRNRRNCEPGPGLK